MLEALAVLLWPVGIGAILAVTALLARRSDDSLFPATAPVAADHNGSGDPAVGSRSAGSSIIGLLLLMAAGALVVYALTALLGTLVVHGGPSIDNPIYSWTIHHRLPFWKSFMDRVTRVGDTWTMWGAAVTAAVCLAAFYRRRKWLPPVALGAAIFIDHYVTMALRHTFHRVGPPDSLDGTYPSGGCDRIIVFYGLIAYLIWREVGGSKRVAIWSAGAVAAVGFSEAYSRGYLTLHWFSDIVSGLIYGTLLLSVSILAIRLVDGPARTVMPGISDHPAVAGQPAPTPQ